MKIVLRIICILFILFLLKDCMGLFYLRISHLSNDNLEWIKNAELDGVFTSNIGKIARSKIRGRYINNKTNPFYISSAGNYYYKANAGYEYVIEFEGKEMPGRFAISKPLDNDSVVFTACLNRFCTLDGNHKYTTYQTLTSQRMTINGVTFQNCICCDTINCGYGDYFKYDSINNRIDKFIINKRFGLIYFRFKNGDEFFRKFKSK